MHHSLPMAYNYVHHEVSDSLRNLAGKPKSVQTTEYHKLCLSFLSGLPNEQEIALNTCNILSNEEQHVRILHLKHTPQLVDLLIAQTGIWPYYDCKLREVYLEIWKDIEGRKMEEFWKTTLDCSNPEIMSLWGMNINPRDEDSDFLNLDQDLQDYCQEGQRILKVLVILYNLSFEKHNIQVLAQNPNCIRLLLLSSHCKWSSLKQIALDTIGNLASQISLNLEKSLSSRLVWWMVSEGILSSDRFLVIRSLDILSQLCLCENNEEIISSNLKFQIWEKIFSFLTVHDIMLIIYTLEALYSFSGLGKRSCEKLIRVHKCVGILVSLLTFEPCMYGVNAQSNFKLVEVCEPVDESNIQHATRSNDGNTNSHCVSSVSVAEMDSESFASHWLRSLYEYAPGYSVIRDELYADYVKECSRAGRKGVLSAANFNSCVKKMFPQSALKMLESENYLLSFHHKGIRKKSNPNFIPSKPSPSAVHLKSQVSKPGMTNTSVLSSPLPSTPSPPPTSVTNPNTSPILKAQLSAPPRSSTPSPCYNSVLSQVLAACPSRPTLSSHCATSFKGTTSGSSTLIKSLLASKVSTAISHSQNASVIVTQNNWSNQSPQARVSSTISINISPSQEESKVGCTTKPTSSTILFTSSSNPNRTKSVITHTRCAKVKLSVPTHFNGIQKKVFFQEEKDKDLMNTENQVHKNGPSFDHNMPTKYKILAQSSKEVKVDDASKVQNRLPLPNHLSATISPPLSSKENPVENTLKFRTLTIKNQNENMLVNPAPPLSLSHLSNHTSTTKVTSSTQFLKSVLSRIQESETEEGRCSQQTVKGKAYKNSPLLNGLLDKGKLPMAPLVNSSHLLNGKDGIEKNCAMSETVFMNSVEVQNGSAVSKEISLREISDSGDSVTSSTEVSGSLSLQKGFLKERLKITNGSKNSLEHPSQSPDLSSISDIAHTLDCASKAITRTNIECSSNKLPINNTLVLSTTVSSTSNVVTSRNLPISNCPKAAFIVNVVNPSHSAHSKQLLLRATGTVSTKANENYQHLLLKPVAYSSKVDEVPPKGLLQSIVDSLNKSEETAQKVVLKPVTNLQTDSSENFQKFLVQATVNSSLNLEEISQKFLIQSTVNSSVNLNENPQKIFVQTNATPSVNPVEIPQKLLVQATSSSYVKPSESAQKLIFKSKNNQTEESEKHSLQSVIITSFVNSKETSQKLLLSDGKKPDTKKANENSKRGFIKVSNEVRKKPNSEIKLMCFQHSSKFPTAETNFSENKHVKRPSTSISPSPTNQPEVKRLRHESQTVIGQNNEKVKSSSSAIISRTDMPEVINLNQCVGLVPKKLHSSFSNVNVQQQHQLSDSPPIKHSTTGKKNEEVQSSKSSNTISRTKPPQKSSSFLEMKYTCGWKGCGKTFQTPSAVLVHSYKIHTPTVNGDFICQWNGCDTLKRKQLSLLTHFQDYHCMEQVLQNHGKSTNAHPFLPPPHPGYAPDAARLAIRRHAVEFINPREFMEKKESPLEKSIRITAALILRNLTINSELARRYLKRYEPDLTLLAMSSMEASQIIAHCLAEAARIQDS
ncbi:uncharacterized protein LOC143225610 isoform X2 [Tachypleus tridentatus]